MTRTKHIFRQDVPCLQYAALGDTAVRALTIYHLTEIYELDALIVVPNNPSLLPLWKAVFGERRILCSPQEIPEDFNSARISAPTSLDWFFGTAGWNVFESVMWENGFFDTEESMITPPVVFPCAHHSGAVMISPAEGTDGNLVFDSDWWIRTCSTFRAAGYRLNHLGTSDHRPLAKLYGCVQFDRYFEPTIEDLRDCVAASSLAIGGSTGPTWVLLFSDIPQIVLESRRSPHGYWFFERCHRVLTKRLKILHTLESLIPVLDQRCD